VHLCGFNGPVYGVINSPQFPYSVGIFCGGYAPILGLLLKPEYSGTARHIPLQHFPGTQILEHRLDMAPGDARELANPARRYRRSILLESVGQPHDG